MPHWHSPPTDEDTRFAAEAAAALRASLQAWPLYRPIHEVFGVAMGDSAISLGYHPYGSGQRHAQTTHLDLNVIQHAGVKVCYLISIGLDAEHRGQGLGRELYQLVEDFATALGCSRVVLTASGKTYRGDTRADYMRRLGYEVDGSLCTKHLVADSLQEGDG